MGLTLAAAILALPTSLPATGIGGLWLSAHADACIEITISGAWLSGHIAWLQDPLDATGLPHRDGSNPDPLLRNRPILGLVILTGFRSEPDHRGRWNGGHIYDPKSGKTYKCRMAIAENGQLEIHGFVGLSIFGRTERWTWVTRAQIESWEAGKAFPSGASCGKRSP